VIAAAEFLKADVPSPRPVFDGRRVAAIVALDLLGLPSRLMS